MKFETRLKFADKVVVDGGDMVGIVIGFAFYQHGSLVNVSWWNNGQLAEQWIAEARLTRVE